MRRRRNKAMDGVERTQMASFEGTVGHALLYLEERRKWHAKIIGHPGRLSETSSHLLSEIVKLFEPLTDFKFPFLRT